MSRDARTFEELQVGDTAQFEVIVDDASIDTFAHLSGDTNPLHTDDAFAARTPLKGRVAHGMLGAAFFSQLVGMHLPGTHALYLSQSLQFRRPIRPGTRVVVRGTITQTSAATRTITLATTILDATTQEVYTDGEALVKLLA